MARWLHNKHDSLHFDQARRIISGGGHDEYIVPGLLVERAVLLCPDPEIVVSGLIVQTSKPDFPTGKLKD